MNKNYLWVCTAFLVGKGLSAQEQQKDSVPLYQLQEVVVSDSKFELKRENSGKTVIKITAEELERNQGRTLAEIINTKNDNYPGNNAHQAGNQLATWREFIGFWHATSMT